MSGLLSQLKRDVFKPTLFDSAISSLSFSISNQTQMASALSDFIVSKNAVSLIWVMLLYLSPLHIRGSC